MGIFSKQPQESKPTKGAKAPREPRRRYRALSSENPQLAASLRKKHKGEYQAGNFGSGERWVNDTTRHNLNGGDQPWRG